MAWSWSVCGTAKVVWKPVAVLHWITLRARPSMSATGPSPFHFSHSFCARHLLSKQGRQFANSPHSYMIDNRKPLSSADLIFSSACAALEKIDSINLNSIDSLWGSGLLSLLASQAHQHHGHLTNFWCFWQCGQVPNPAGKWNQHL